MNRIFEIISWATFKLLKKVKKVKKKFVYLDLRNIGINRKFKFYLSECDEGLSFQLKAFGFREQINL